MAIRPFQSDDLPALHEIYCAVTAPLAHGFAPSIQEFADAFCCAPPHLRESLLMVAEAAGRPVGFARAGRDTPIPERWSLASEGDGMLLGPFVPAERLEEGDALVRTALAHVRIGPGRAWYAFDPAERAGLPFYNGGWCGLSEKLPHIARLLTQAGFRIRHRELCLTRPTLEAPPFQQPAPPFNLRLERRGGHRHSIRLYDGELFVGACHYSPMAPERSRHPEARHWGYINGLAVEERYQGRGIGRLLLAYALRHLREMGCGPVCLTTGSENYRAQNLYFSLGFALVDSALTFQTNL